MPLLENEAVGVTNGGMELDESLESVQRRVTSQLVGASVEVETVGVSTEENDESISDLASGETFPA